MRCRCSNVFGLCISLGLVRADKARPVAGECEPHPHTRTRLRPHGDGGQTPCGGEGRSSAANIEVCGWGPAQDPEGRATRAIVGRSDPPPLKWSTLSYVFARNEDRNAEEELQAG